MESVGALQPILRKLSDALDLFDLSFFVGGASSLLALAVLGRLPLDNLVSVPGLAGLVFLALVTVVLGLVGFSAGRFLRRLLPQDDRSALLRRALDAHGLLQDDRVQPYLDDDDLEHLYTRLWAEIREARVVSEGFALLRRYWVLAATYDSLAASSLLWGVAITRRLLLGGTDLPVAAALGVAAALPICLLTLREAARMQRYQIEELAATLAALRVIELRA